MTDDVEAALRDLATKVHVPEPPDLTARVHARITAPRKRNRLLALILALLTAIGVAVAVSPAVRAGVVEILKFAGIEFRSQAPTSVAPPLPEREMSLEEARKQLPFDIHVPALLGPPRKVTVYEGRFVTLHYDHARVDQFDGNMEQAMAKVLGEEDSEWVDGAVWIPRPHQVYYVDRNGMFHHEEPRGTGKTLIWQRGAVTMRLQGELTREEALRVKGS